MSIPQATVFNYDKDEFTLYNFAKALDVIPMHTHDYSHLTVVVSGRIKATDGSKSSEFGPANVINFASGKPHEIIALEDNTVILNIFKP